MPFPYVVERLARHDLAALDQLDLELPAGQLGRQGPGADDLRSSTPCVSGRRAAHLRPPIEAFPPSDFFATGRSGAFGSAESARATSL